jgi:hypothetical protein
VAHYAVSRRGGEVELVVIWQDSSGRYVEPLTRASVEHLDILREIGICLEGLSESLWTSYADESLDVDEAAAGVDDMLIAPEWPQGGYIAAYLDPVHEHTARLARAVAACPLPSVADAVRAEIDREFDALARATLGDFGGRAGQATWRNRADASPTQVAAAHEVLRRHAEGAESIDGLSYLEPAAACSALVSWCVAAAEVYGELSGRAAADAGRAAADVANLDTNTIDGVLHGVLAEERRPVDVVADLLPALDGRKLFGSLVFGYFALWELIEQQAQTSPVGAPVVGGLPLTHPRGADWAGLDRDTDEYLQAWHQAVEAELGRRVAGRVRDST